MLIELKDVNKTYQGAQPLHVLKGIDYNAVAAQEKFRSSLDADASAKESYDLVLAKYENGKANITEFTEARDSFLESGSNLARARYEFLFSVKLLDFYKGQRLEF